MGVVTWWCATVLLFFFNDTATTDIYTLSLHDALPISMRSFTRTGSRSHEKPAGSQLFPGGIVGDAARGCGALGGHHHNALRHSRSGSAGSVAESDDCGRSPQSGRRPGPEPRRRQPLLFRGRGCRAYPLSIARGIIA